VSLYVGVQQIAQIKVIGRPPGFPIQWKPVHLNHSQQSDYGAEHNSGARSADSLGPASS